MLPMAPRRGRAVGAGAAPATANNQQTSVHGGPVGTVGLPSEIAEAVAAWSEYVGEVISHVCKATGFAHFAITFEAGKGRCAIVPQHYVIVFPSRDQGRHKHHSALLTLRAVQEDEIPRDPNVQGPVANHLRFKPPAERRSIPGAESYIEFEILSRPHEAPSQQPLRITTGPVHLHKESGHRECVCIEFSQCVQSVATDIISDVTGAGKRLVQHRWWMCIETLKLLCTVNHIDCTSLDKPGGIPLEWAICLLNARAPINEREQPQEPPQQNIDELMKFIDGGASSSGISAGGAQRSRRRKGKDKESDASAIGMASDASAATAAASAVERGGDERPALAGSVASAAKAVQQVGREAPPWTHSASASNGSAPPCPSRAPPSGHASASSASAPRASLADEDLADSDLMHELLCKYQQLQEMSQRLGLETKVRTIRELLEVLDEIEGFLRTLTQDSGARRALVAAARRFESELHCLGCKRIETVGRVFNPGVHSKSAGRHSSAGSSDRSSSQMISEELESGWLLGDTVVRLALVSVEPNAEVT